MLHLKNYTKSYGDRLILQLNDFTLEAGTYWIIGENGSGKSTFFKTIAGLLPFNGSIVLKGMIDQRLQPSLFRSKVNYAEAEPIYPGFATAKDLLHLVAKAKKAPPSQVVHVTTLFGIDRFLTQPCETFSSGMMKKLSLALALLGDPDVLILDEPLITLDVAARDHLIGWLRKLQSERDRIILLSSHQAIADTELSISGTYQVVHQTLTAS